MCVIINFPWRRRSAEFKGGLEKQSKSEYLCVIKLNAFLLLGTQSNRAKLFQLIIPYPSVLIDSTGDKMRLILIADILIIEKL